MIVVAVLNSIVLYASGFAAVSHFHPSLIFAGMVAPRHHDIQYKGLACDTQHNSIDCHYILNAAYFIVTLSVIELSVVAPAPTKFEPPMELWFSY
jgi:hypothetical protein